MRKVLFTIALLGACGVAGLWITRPQSVDGPALAALTPDLANGALVYSAMGCASCHKAAENGDPAVLAGGASFETQFGTFYAPNISSHPENGIGNWSDMEVANAVIHGTLPQGRHAYPAFPYTSYNKATLQDVTDLTAYLRTLPADATPSRAHDVGFPFNIRASLGGWKMMFASDAWVLDGDLSDTVVRGRYLVEALGHCGECHTPRGALGGLQKANWLMGAANPSGEGRIPGIHPSVLDWSESDIVAYLNSGFTPDFDVAGGKMADVIENTAQLPEADLQAIAAYLKSLR